MTKTKRTQIYLLEEQILLLRDRAAASNGSVSSEIREAIDRYLTDRGGPRPGDDPVDSLIGQIAGTPRDLSARVDDYLYGSPAPVPAPARRRRAGKAGR